MSCEEVTGFLNTEFTEGTEKIEEKTQGSAGKREFSMTNEERKAALEAIIYAADEPATIEQLAKALGEEKLVVQAVLEMVKLQAVGLAQEKQFGEIVVKKGKSFDVIFDEAGGIKQIDEEYK